MARGRSEPDEMTRKVRELVTLYAGAMEAGNLAILGMLPAKVVESCGSADRAVAVLLNLAAGGEAKCQALAANVQEKNQILRSIMAAPRRLAKVVGLIRCQPGGPGGSEPGPAAGPDAAEEPESPGTALADPGPWAVLQGPPPQAVRFHPDCSPDDIWPEGLGQLGQPDQPVWVWLVETDGGVVVAGRIEAPPLLRAGLERELVFEEVIEGAEHEE